MKKNGQVIGIDLGGTNLRVAIVEKNRITNYVKRPTPKTKKELVKVMFESIDLLMTPRVKGIGVSSAGPLFNGVIKNPPNLPLKNFDLAGALRKRFHKKVVVENDANCVAFAEHKLGCRKRNFIIYTIGTGIGGGIIFDGKLYEGNGYGGELGHTMIHDGVDFEDTWQNDKKAIHTHYGRDLNVIDLMRIKNKNSREFLDRIADHFAQGFASGINIFDPEIVVLSGGMRETGDKFLKMVKKHLRKYVIIPVRTPIEWTRLEHPGILGAALLINNHNHNGKK